MHGFALGVYFVKHAWEEHRAIHARVERAQAVGVVILHADAPKDVVPCAAAFFLGLVEALDAYLLQVQFRLFGADERRSYTYIHLFAFVGFETNHCTGMLVFCFQLICIDIAIGNGNDLLTILVLSGETTPEMLLAAKDEPDIVCKGLPSLTPLL